MTTPISDRDWEAISAYLDGELNPKEQARLDARLQTNADLRAALEDLRRTRAVLRSQPRLHAPRNFTISAQAVGQVQQRRPALRLSPVFGMVSAFASFLLVLVIAGEFLTAGQRTQTMLMAAEVIQEAAPLEMEALVAATSQADQVAKAVPAEAPAVTEEIMLAQEAAADSGQAAQPPSVAGAEVLAYPPPTLAASSAALIYPAPAERILGAVEAPPPESTPVVEGESTAERSSAGEAALPVPTEGLAQVEELSTGVQEAQPDEVDVGESQSQPVNISQNGWRAAQLLLILMALVSGVVAILLRRSGA